MFCQPDMKERHAIRGGFTLVEVMIVIAIMLALMALSLGAVFKGMGYVRRANTEHTMQKVDQRLKLQIERLYREARDADVSNTNLLNLAGQDRRRAKVLYLKMLVKWHFPMSFNEINSNRAESALYRADGTTHPICEKYWRRTGGAGGTHGINTNNPDLNYNAACLGIVYESLGGLDDLAGTELVMRQMPPGGNSPTYPQIMDAWARQPLVYFRWPMQYQDTRGRVEAYYPGMAGRDADDPEGLLDRRRTENNNWYSTVSGAFTNLFYPLPTQPVYLPIVLGSAGQDNAFGLSDDLMTIGNAGEESDNFYSFRSRLAVTSQQ